MTAFLEKEYKEDLDEKEAVSLGIRALRASVEEGQEFRPPEIATIVEGSKFKIYTREEVEKAVQNA